ncbi:glycosyltransferase [Dermatobacter hominis]|uniref:glycosyltransferase n=1 Tax=Dermatobacter hominis TaxID=2884263 RepID=UPI001D11B85F|nr:glycosyltransferase [Dermatobacter hominis]UDY35123.1 glycosyltransferase [Dermatobacter hominis]
MAQAYRRERAPVNGTDRGAAGDLAAVIGGGGSGRAAAVPLQDARPLPVTLLVPIRHERVDEGLVAHLGEVRHAVDEVLVVDGSEAAVAGAYRRSLDPTVGHLPVDPDLRPLRNGKVAGVLTGLRLAGSDVVVIADDDVRHTRATLAELLGRIDGADAVRPQNHFVARPGARLPWHARWDTGRTLLNRALGGDWPGTFAVRSAALHRTGGYDGDVLFENLELLRTVRAGGGRVVDAPDVFVPRLAPSAAVFRRQRVRQAYDSFAQPARLGAELALLPLALLRPRWVPAVLAGAVVAAEVGRRRHDGRSAFDATAALWAAPWLVERSVCSWLAVLARARGGVRYSGSTIVVAAHGERELEARCRRGELDAPRLRCPDAARPRVS